MTRNYSSPSFEFLSSPEISRVCSCFSFLGAKMQQTGHLPQFLTLETWWSGIILANLSIKGRVLSFSVLLKLAEFVLVSVC